MTNVRPSYEGLVSARKARFTGRWVGISRAAEAGFESDPTLPWATVCEEHGGIVLHETRKLAEAHACEPDQWCPTCQLEIAADKAWVARMVRIDLSDTTQAAQFGSWYEARWPMLKPSVRRMSYAAQLRYLIEADHADARAEDDGAAEVGREWDVYALALRAVAVLVPLYSPSWHKDEVVETRPGFLRLLLDDQPDFDPDAPDQGGTLVVRPF